MIDTSTGVLVSSGVYVALLVLTGALARRARVARTLTDHFLANRSIGFLVLLFTLFATQYSGNSVSGFPGQTYRQGLSYFMTVTFMVGIVSGYTLFAPRLFSLSRRRRYLTPTDFLADRFASPVLDFVSATIFTLTLLNFLLAQLMALGHAFSGLTAGQIPYEAGVAGGAFIILVYELMGGMRAVAWTDVLQGGMLAIGLLLVISLLVETVGTPAGVLASIASTAPEKVASPGVETCFTWLSNFLLLALGAPLYPQAIQRIYAAVELRALKKALAIMAFLPLVAVTAVVFIGAAGIALFPGLDEVESDQITFRVLAHLTLTNEHAYYPVLLVMMAVVAAIMSTADSCLLSLASILTKDFAARVLGLTGQAERLTRLVPFFSIVIVAGLVALAMRPLTTLWGLLVVKFEVLIQLSPAFVLGTLHERGDPRAFTARDILAGLAAGAAFTLVLYLQGMSSLHGFHAGTAGVVVNYLVVVVSRRLRRRGGRGRGG